MKNDFLQNMAPNAKRSAVVTLILGAIAAVLYNPSKANWNSCRKS